MSHVLVTGGDGLVGSHVVDELLARSHEVGVLDVLHPAALAAAPACRNPDADHRLGDVRHVFADPAPARRSSASAPSNQREHMQSPRDHGPQRAGTLAVFVGPGRKSTVRWSSVSAIGVQLASSLPGAP